MNRIQLPVVESIFYFIRVTLKKVRVSKPILILSDEYSPLIFFKSIELMEKSISKKIKIIFLHEFSLYAPHQINAGKDVLLSRAECVMLYFHFALR